MTSCASSAGGASSAISTALQFFMASQCLFHQDWSPQPDNPNGSSYDFIIVGGGTAGSMMASRLSEVANVSVLLVEAGGSPPFESDVPGYASTLHNSQYDWNFTSVNDSYSSQALTDGRQRLPCGKMLGGSGSYNSMIYSRGYPADYEEWAEIAGPQWKWDNVLKYFKKTEKLTDPMILDDPKLAKYHGTGGDIEVAGLQKLDFVTNKFLDAFSELGFQVVEDMNNPYSVGAGQLSFTIRDGVRDSTFASLRHKAFKRSNLHVLKNALVTKILMENKTAYGVRVLQNNEELNLFANKEVIVSAGAYNTAKLLLLSGIGPKEHLEEVGVEVVQDLPVGDNLREQPSIFHFVATENGSCYSSEATSNFNVIQYLYDRSGPLAMSSRIGLDLALNGSSTPNVADFAIFPQCVKINGNYFKTCKQSLDYRDEICSQLDFVNKRYELLTFFIVLLKPKSKGKVRLRSNNPLDKPLIYTGTFSDDEDLERYLEPIRIVHSIAKTSYFKKRGAHVVDLDVDECEGLRGVDEVKCKSRALAVANSHVVGTAVMGAVVDGRLRVAGVARLRVVDASVMPWLRGNTNSPVTMVAEMAADFIKEDHGILD